MSYIETTDRRDFGSKPSNWWGRMLSWKIQKFCSVGGARSKNSIFRVSFDYRTILHNLQETVLPQTNGTEGKPKLKVCLLLVWRVWPGRYRPLKGAKKWSCDYHENWKFAYRNAEKNQIPKMLFFSIYDKKTVSEQWRHQALVAFLVNAWFVLNWRSSIHPSSFGFVWTDLYMPTWTTKCFVLL